MTDQMVHWLANIWLEIALFSVVGMSLLSLDDFIFDMVWLWQRCRLRFSKRLTDQSLEKDGFQDRPLAVFIPTWQEEDVIGQMLAHLLRQWRDETVEIFIGHYPNDPATRQAISRNKSKQLHMVETPNAGPTTKADCLNALWHAMLEFETRSDVRFSAVILHDAEDVVHREELAVYRKHLRDAALVQIPVLPIIDPQSPWISGHYADEFAEAHSRDLVVRNSLGTALPLAGVGCAIRRDALNHIAHQRGGIPFDETSLTEDYELGLVLGTIGYKSRFCRTPEASGHLPVATQAHFPNRLDIAIRQKTRWQVGIALVGWQKLGWQGGLTETWMRLRDRRSIFSAITLFLAYCSGLIYLLLMALHLAVATPALVADSAINLLGQFCIIMLFWRALVRMLCVGRHYGPRQALRSLPRMLISSFVAIAAARSAVLVYLHHLKTGQLPWYKTAHSFPKELSA